MVVLYEELKFFNQISSSYVRSALIPQISKGV
jgi:hypothetical protein